MDCLLIIDGSSLLSSSFYGTIPKEYYKASTTEELEIIHEKIMHTSYGVYTNGIFAFTKTFLNIISEIEPSHLVVCWDLSRETFRKEIYPQYKANRKDMPSPLQDQYKLMQLILSKSNVPILGDYYLEADDYACSLVNKFQDEIYCVSLTRDEDYLQLISENSSLWLINNKSTLLSSQVEFSKSNVKLPKNILEVNVSNFKDFTKLNSPSQICDFKGLVGDVSDNIPGVSGIGPITASKLLNYFGSLDNIYKTIGSFDDSDIKKFIKNTKKELRISSNIIDTLLVNKAIAYKSKLLSTMKSDIFEVISMNLDDLKFNVDYNSLRKELNYLEIYTLI